MKRNDLLGVLEAIYDQGQASRTQPDIPPSVGILKVIVPRQGGEGGAVGAAMMVAESLVPGLL